MGPERHEAEQYEELTVGQVITALQQYDPDEALLVQMPGQDVRRAIQAVDQFFWVTPVDEAIRTCILELTEEIGEY